jgi:Rrf2 family protein
MALPNGPNPEFLAMLSISSKSLYGLKALLYLAEYQQKGVLQMREIAASQNIPQNYLEQIFNLLGKANIIRSVRGKNGGYRLAGEPSEITVKDIILLLEGGIELVSTESDPGDVISITLQKAENALLQALSISLAELLAMHLSNRNIMAFDI